MRNVVLVLSANVDTISQLESLKVCYKLKYRCYYCDEKLFVLIDAEQNNLIVPTGRYELRYGNVTYILEAMTSSYCICRAYGAIDGYRFPRFYHEIYKQFAELIRFPRFHHEIYKQFVELMRHTNNQ